MEFIFQKTSLLAILNQKAECLGINILEEGLVQMLYCECQIKFPTVLLNK